MRICYSVAVLVPSWLCMRLTSMEEFLEGRFNYLCMAIAIAIAIAVAWRIDYPCLDTWSIILSAIHEW